MEGVYVADPNFGQDRGVVFSPSWFFVTMFLEPRGIFTSRTCFLVIPRGTIIRFLGKLLVFPLSCVDYHACLLAILYWLSALSNEYVTVFV